LYSLAIIGVGQLGSRHLQALSRLTLPCEIYVIDPSNSSLEIARQRFNETPLNAFIREVHYHTVTDVLPRTLDYVIVATTADVRLGVLESLLKGSKVTSMLLEKVLFQRLDEYTIAKNLLETYQIRTWVNCVYRTYPICSEIREFFSSEPLRYMQVRGGDWGLGCNSIHYLDILSMLTDALPVSFFTSDLDSMLVPSRRKNFQEFTGMLRGKYAGGVDFEITSVAGSSARLLLTLRSEHRTCIIDETSGGAVFFNSNVGSGGTWECKKFKIPLLSELGATIATQILTHGTCALPTYEQSMGYHLPLIKALGAHAAACNGTPPDFCPIT
jgi:hypothetical protein